MWLPLSSWRGDRRKNRLERENGSPGFCKKGGTEWMGEKEREERERRMGREEKEMGGRVTGND